jgi:hypothetical protein
MQTALTVTELFKRLARFTRHYFRKAADIKNSSVCRNLNDCRSQILQKMNHTGDSITFPLRSLEKENGQQEM